MTRSQAEAVMAFADQLGVFFEASGHAPLIGRILGLLLASEPALQSARDISETLGVSRSAVSMALTPMQRNGMVRKVKQPGIRETFYTVSDDGWRRFQQDGQKSFAAARRLAERALEGLADRDAQTNERLSFFRDFYAFLEREMPSLLERWEQECRRTGRL